MIEHRSPLSAVACGPSGLIATTGYDNQVILWDSQWGTPLSRVFHDHLVNHCSFSPDGEWLATSSSDCTARVWHVPDLKLHSVLTGHRDDVEMAVFSPDGSRIATASRDHGVRIFDRCGSLLANARGHDADTLSVAWTSDGKSVISAGDDGTVRCWCALNGALVETMSFDSVETDTVVVDRGGVVFAGNDRGEILRLRGRSIRRQIAHEAGIKRLAIDPTGQLLVSTSYDRRLKLWRISDQDTLDLLHAVTMPPVIWARGATFTPEGKIVLSTFGSSYAIYDPASREWDLDRVHSTFGLNAVVIADGITYSVGDAGIVYRDGTEHAATGSLCNFLVPWSKGLLTGGHLGTVFDAHTGSPLFRHRSPLNCGVSLSSTRVLLGSYTGEGLVLEADADGTLCHIADIRMHNQAVKGMAVHGHAVFSVSASGDAAFWRSEDMTLVKHIDAAHDKISNGAAALPDGRFVSVSRDLTLRIWSGTDAEISKSPHMHSIKCVSTSRGGRWIATGSYGGQIGFYDVARSAWSSVVRPTMAGISCLTPALDADSFLASSYDGCLYLVNPRTERPDPIPVDPESPT